MKHKNMIRGLFGLLAGLLAVLPLLTAGITASAAQTGSEGPYTYQINGSSASIIAYDGITPTVQIPDQLGGKKVTKIEQNVFSNLSNLTKVVISKNITTIDSRAFYNCANLETVVFASTSPRVTIRDMAFAKCYKLKEISTKGIRYVKRNVFEDTAWFAEQKKNNSLVIAGAVVIACGDVPADELQIPEGVKEIPAEALAGTNASSIICPASLTIIGSNAFKGSANLRELTVMNPECVIQSGSETLRPNGETLTVRGYEGSKAEEEALANGLTFVALDGAAPKTASTFSDGRSVLIGTVIGMTGILIGVIIGKTTGKRKKDDLG